MRTFLISNLIEMTDLDVQLSCRHHQKGKKKKRRKDKEREEFSVLEEKFIY